MISLQSYIPDLLGKLFIPIFLRALQFPAATLRKCSPMMICNCLTIFTDRFICRMIMMSYAARLELLFLLHQSAVWVRDLRSWGKHAFVFVKLK